MRSEFHLVPQRLRKGLATYDYRHIILHCLVELTISRQKSRFPTLFDIGNT